MIYRKLILVAVVGFVVLGLNRPSPAIAALSVGAEFGGNFISDLELKGSTRNISCPNVIGNTVDPSFMGGLIVEYHFIDKGALKYDWPAWMKNFSVALDFTYNPIEFGHQTTRFVCNDPNWGTVSLPEFKGYVLTLSLLFKYRFPLLRQQDYPDGRLFYYLGVGPGFSYNYLEANNTIPGNIKAVGHGTATAATFVAETGLSLFVVRDVSVDLFFRYRYLSPNYEFNIGVAGAPLYLRFDNNSYNAGLRIAFHF
jgi:hypothetical protein